MVNGLGNVGHVVIMDNFFLSIGLFQELLGWRIYAIETVRLNRIGLPMVFKNTMSFKSLSQGTTLWRMHDSKQIKCTIWKDKSLFFLLPPMHHELLH